MHQPVLLREVLEYLAIKPKGVYVDATFGRGGHAKAIMDSLSSEGRLIGIDKDLEAVAHAKKMFANDPRFLSFHGSFSQIHSFLSSEHLEGQVDGIVADLGVSSPQLDNAQRGFSFQSDKVGPLDMRMNQTEGMSVGEWLKKASEDEIVEVLRDYGEERFAKRIAEAIVRDQMTQPLTTTKQLADLVERVVPYRGQQGIHPATRTFQAFRIFINRELEELAVFLEQCFKLLKTGGRLLVISFHSLEDRIVKRFIKGKTSGPAILREIHRYAEPFQPEMRQVGSLIRPSSEEIEQNRRARSARMRVAEKLS